MLLWLLIACAPCEPAADITIIDDAGSEPALMADVRRGVDDFIAWTGRETVCVSEVVVRDEIAGNKLGRYNQATRRVLIAADNLDPQGTVRHELCHGLDAAEHHSRDELFDGKQRREGFALACEQGAPYAEVLGVLNDECDAMFVAVPGDAAVRAYLREGVFVDAPFVVLEDRVGLNRDTTLDLERPVDEPWWGRGLVATSDSVLQVTQVRPARSSRYQTIVVESSLDSGAVLRRIDLPEAPDVWTSWLSIMGGAGLAIVTRTDDRADAWRVDLETGVAAVMTLPGLEPGDMPRGAVVGSTLAFSVGSLVRSLDLDSGAAGVLLQLDDGMVTDVQADGDGFLVVSSQGLGRLALDGSGWEPSAFPPWPWGSYYARALPDGRTLLQLLYFQRDSSGDGDSMTSRYSWLVGTPDQGWAIAGDPCEDIGDPFVADGVLYSVAWSGDTLSRWSLD